MQNNGKLKVAGVHLAGPNSTKTTLAILSGLKDEGGLKIVGLYDRMGTVHKLFSDDRLFEVLRVENPDRVMIDCPLSVPPCVACTRPLCPGVDACEDIAVAYMQKMVDTKSGKKKKKPMNPQTQRIWDLKEWYHWHPSLQEPTYSSNKAPLVVRSLTLQRRLNSLEQPLRLFETSIPHAISALVEELSLPKDLAYEYRAFGVGREKRLTILSKLVESGYLDSNIPSEAISSIEMFSAVIAGVVAAMEQRDQVSRPENEFFREQGWVYLPKLSATEPKTPPRMN